VLSALFVSTAEDARHCLLPDDSPDVLYQIACVFALTSPGHDDDRREALALLGRAFTRGFDKIDLFENDPDLAALRSDGELQRLTRAARDVRARVRRP
jgi:hypothetical protein